MPHNIGAHVAERSIVSDNGELIISLNEGETLFVKKFVKFKVLRGACTLMGYTFTQSDCVYTVQIPKWNPPEQIIPIATTSDGIKLDSITLSFTNYVSAFDTYSLIDCVEGTTISGDSALTNIGFTKIVPDLWHKCADLIPKNGCVALHGEKGVGKSTATLYLANYLLNNCPKIAIVDVDVGQPLFTVPGIISLHILDGPILRPEYSMVNEHFVYSKKILIGDVTISNPKKLLERTIILEKYLKESIADLKITDYRVIINTGGWISDTGGQLFDCIVKLFNVDVVLSILSKTGGIGYKPQEINLLLDIISHHPIHINQPEVISVDSYKIVNNTIAVPKPSDLRWLRVATYLNPALGESLEIHSFTHYEFFSGIHEYRFQSIIKNASFFTPPVTYELKMSNLTFYLPCGIKLQDSQLQNHFLAGCMAALFVYTETYSFESLINAEFLLAFLHSVDGDKLLILVPKHKSITHLDDIRSVVLCPMLGFDPQFPRFGRSNSTSFVPFGRNAQLHLTNHLGTRNCSRRGVKKRPYEEDKA